MVDDRRQMTEEALIRVNPEFVLLVNFKTKKKKRFRFAKNILKKPGQFWNNMSI